MQTHYLFKLIWIIPVVMVLTFMTSCDDDDPEPENEEELITTLIVTFTQGGNTIQQTFRDLDGDGGSAPEIVTNPVDANTAYTVTVEVLNELENPPEDITEEVEEEAEEHQFFFQFAGISVDHEYDDSDADGNPIGVTNTMTTGGAGSGDFTVTLRHEPDKDASGVSDGDITNAGGETDIEVTFQLVIQ